MNEGLVWAFLGNIAIAAIACIFCMLWGHQFEPGPKQGQKHCAVCGKVIG